PLDRYVVAPLTGASGDGAEIKIHYRLLRAFDPNKPTLVVVSGGPGDDQRLVPMFFSRIAEHANVLGFDHRGIGCSRSLSPWQSTYRKGIFSTTLAAQDMEAIRKDLLGP